jgi:hypothetical protein
MSTTTNTAETRTTLTARLGTSRYGNPMPRIDVRAPRGTPHRLVSAELHELAAKVERGTPPREGWCVTVQHGSVDETGTVLIELVGGRDGEAERAMELLNRVVG